MVIYDFVASEKFGFARVPIFGVMDKTGKVIFDSRGETEVETTTYYDEQTKKEYPKSSTYVFHDDDATVKFNVTWTDIIEVRDMYGATADQVHYGMAGEQQRKAYDAMGIKPAYMRYYANGTLTMTNSEGTVEESGDMIYEFNYPGVPDPRAHLG
ncbi:hypothetical protein [Ancrocorticia populi]|uniref:Uncharacterized protein n=1 Tax=Ancrocorticia populi TaxID=2175228 RepID=A0A2V1KCK9_9ACTO|nr:hypothetical protein [Ancrocorticia populi]PWF27247.1 hypothetical protein DD236_02280 [Ancrocorticia populi]